MKAEPCRIHLSPPHLGEEEGRLLQEALASNWIAPLGPQVDAFEEEFAQTVGAGHAAALSSGTAALHLALRLAGVGPGDEVLCSTLTFAASAFAIRYQDAVPVFLDCDQASWGMDPALLAEELEQRAAKGRLPRAVLLVHLYGQCADLDPILEVCREHGVSLIEDAAEALGATYKGRHAGTRGMFGTYSFNGNKIITTSGGGMLVAGEESLIRRARNLAAQARDPAPHYQHSQIGFNYRLSNLLAAVGRGQLRVLEERVERRRANFTFYQEALGKVPGIRFMPDPGFGRSTRWLTVLTLDPDAFGASREQVRLHLETRNIEARPVWKPMHLQPVFRGFPRIGGRVAEELFADGLCLPSGSDLTPADLDRVAEAVLETPRKISGGSRVSMNPRA